METLPIETDTNATRYVYDKVSYDTKEPEK